jgi:alpha-ribazole phosphatase
MTRLLLLRHGQTAWNLDGRFMGQMDIPLDETGLQQAEAAARRLARQPIQAIYSSDLSRAWQTAQIVHQAILGASSGGPTVPLVVEPRLREMSFGDWQGLTYAQIQELYPQELATWEADLLECSPPGGETLNDLIQRAQAAYLEILAANLEESVLIVGHGGALQTLCCLALGLPPERFWQLHLSNASLSELRIYPTGAILNLFNDTCHLEQAN